MGSTGSRPRLRKVAPCNSLQEEGAQLEPQWTLPALPVTVEQQAGFLGQKKTILPSLRQEITLSTLSGQGPQRWGCPPVFYNRHNDSGRIPGGPDRCHSTGSSASSPPKT